MILKHSILILLPFLLSCWPFNKLAWWVHCTEALLLSKPGTYYIQHLKPNVQIFYKYSVHIVWNSSTVSFDIVLPDRRLRSPPNAHYSQGLAPALVTSSLFSCCGGFRSTFIPGM
jgi:hypothetical protein